MPHSTILIQEATLTIYCYQLKIGKCGLAWGIKIESELFVLELEITTQMTDN